MDKSFKFLVQKFERGRWTTKFETSDIVAAYEFAKDYAAKTLERVRITRVDECVLATYYFAR